MWLFHLAWPHHSSHIELATVQAYVARQEFGRAAELCELSSDLFGEWIELGRNCAGVYAATRRFDVAEKHYLELLPVALNSAPIHFDLARVYLQLQKRDKAQAHFDLAVQTARQPFLRDYMEARSLIEMYPHDPLRREQAIRLLNRSLESQPRFAPSRKLLESL